LNPAGLERWAKKNGISGLPIGKIASYAAAWYLSNEAGINSPEVTQALSNYISSDYNGFVNGDPDNIAETLNNKKRCLNLFGLQLCFGSDPFDWKILASIGLVAFLGYKFLKA
jgi:hypothetical protein